MIFVLSGAGLSAESGLRTFRDADGLWEGHDPMDVATPEAFARDPALVHRFYNDRRRAAAGAQPNAAHRALARLSQNGAMLVTQNVDGLLDAAGAKNVLHMHGRIDRACCAACGHGWEAGGDLTVETPCPACGAHAARPDIVWFGEMPKGLDDIEAAIDRATLFVAVGTSGQVYPAAGFAAEARARGVPTLELNMEPTGGPFDDARYGPATEVVPAWVAEVMAG